MNRQPSAYGDGTEKRKKKSLDHGAVPRPVNMLN
jgi:hypothetical protein